jgi:hypothetical protein
MGIIYGMGITFEGGFRAWLEYSSASKAVLGVLSGGQERLSPEERSHLMSRKTTDFSTEVRDRVKGLGAIKSVAGRVRRAEIYRSIDDGVIVSDLVNSIQRGLVREDVYESEAEQLARHADIRLSMASQTPGYVKSRREFLSRMRSLGLSADEALKRSDALFGPRERTRP